MRVLSGSEAFASVQGRFLAYQPLIRGAANLFRLEGKVRRVDGQEAPAASEDIRALISVFLLMQAACVAFPFVITRARLQRFPHGHGKPRALSGFYKTPERRSAKYCSHFSGEQKRSVNDHIRKEIEFWLFLALRSKLFDPFF
jgi:hypothetical protein